MFLKFAATVNPKAVQFLDAIEQFEAEPTWDDADIIVNKYFKKVPGFNLDPKLAEQIKAKIHLGMTGLTKMEPGGVFDGVRQIILQTLAGPFSQFKAQLG
jgi:hypothetical protein